MIVLNLIGLYLYNILVGLDQLLNTMLGGHPRETICLRSAKHWRAGGKMGCVLCKVWEFFHADHCRIVAWRHGVDDMPDDETFHISDLFSLAWKAGLFLILAFLAIATVIAITYIEYQFILEMTHV